MQIFEATWVEILSKNTHSDIRLEILNLLEIFNKKRLF